MEEERVGPFAPLRRPPQRLLASALPWLAVLYLVTSLLLAAASFACLIAFPLIPLWGRVLGWVEEWRARALLPEGRDEPPPGWRDAKRWMWRVLTWRQTALVLVNASAGFLVFFLITAALTAFVCSLRLTAGLGVRIGGERIVLAGPHPAWATIALSLLALACNVLLVYALVACALAQAWVSRGLFRADTEAMERQITLLSQRNLGLVEAFEAERQRIERELHDGAQQHLASAAIQLGLAQAGLAGRSAADGHLEAAHGEVEAASAAMRRALAGLRPRTLLERGLGADISEMAAGAPIEPPLRRQRVPGERVPARRGLLGPSVLRLRRRPPLRRHERRRRGRRGPARRDRDRGDGEPHQAHGRADEPGQPSGRAHAAARVVPRAARSGRGPCLRPWAPAARSRPAGEGRGVAVRIAVAEDVVLMRQGIVAVLAGGGHEVVWQTGTASDVLSRFRQAEPDVLVTDVRMPPGHSDDGLRAALGVREEFPDAGILVLSQYVGNEYARRLLAGAHGNSGGTGYLLKESVGRISQFLCAVEEVGAGGVSIDPRVVTELFARPAASPLDELSPRHREVLELVAQGRTNAQIARELYVSRATLERLVSQIFVSLGLSEQDGNRRVLAVLEYLRSPAR